MTTNKITYHERLRAGIELVRLGNNYIDAGRIDEAAEILAKEVDFAKSIKNTQAEKQPTFNELYEFVFRNYKHDRFEGRNTKEWGEDYSLRIVRDYMQTLQENGIAYISKHESVTGQFIKFGLDLNA